MIMAAISLAGVIITTASTDAASVSLTWNAPTTNADGSALADLSSYRIYLGTATPSCPSASFLTVASPTSAPPSGQVVSTRIAALTAGATYFVRISAVDTAGNESSCSTSASGIAQADFSVTPTSTTNFGSVTTGSSADATFTVLNTSTTSITGTASVGAPYSIVSGGSFSLAAGASQVVTVRFRPTAAGTFAGNVTFTASGDTASRVLTGTGIAVPTAALSVTTAGTGAGTVTSTPAGISCGSSCSTALPIGAPVTLTATAASGSAFMGWGGACSGTATCTWTMTATTAVTASFDTTRVAPPLAPAPVPVVGSLSPATATVGSPALTLTVNGSGFVTSSVVRWNGADRTTTVVSATQLTAAITAADLASARSVPVTVFTPTPGGGTSSNVTFTVTAAPLAPTLSSLSPTGATAGGAAFTLIVKGRHFVAGSVVRWNGSDRATTFASTGQLYAAITAADQAAARSVPVTVFTPAPGGGTSSVKSFTVMAPPAAPAPSPLPVPVASGLSPASASSGTAGLTLVVNGSNFVASSIVRWNGADRATTFISATELRATIAAADLTTVRTVPVTVFTPAPGGGTSASKSFSVTTPQFVPVPQPSLLAAPLNLSVTAPVTDASGATFTVAWAGVSGATSYRYSAAFSDGTAAQQGTVSGLLSFQLRMPYHVSGAASGGFVCVRSVNATGQSADQSCLTLTVPARPAAPAPTPQAPSAPPAMPGNPSVNLATADTGGVTFAITWGSASGATSYRYVAAFNDGSGLQQGAVASPSLQLRMPYHWSGAAFGGFVCIRSVNAAGQSADQACSALTVPAR